MNIDDDDYEERRRATLGDGQRIAVPLVAMDGSCCTVTVDCGPAGDGRPGPRTLVDDQHSYDARAAAARLSRPAPDKRHLERIARWLSGELGLPLDLARRRVTAFVVSAQPAREPQCRVGEPATR